MLENYVDDAFSSLEEAVKFRNDIFSDTFKKFVKVYISKYQLYKNFILTLRKLINDSFLEIEKLKKDYFDLEIEFSDFKKSNQSALKKQNIESQKLKLEIEKLKNEYQTAKNEITLLNKENKKLSENCKELNDRIQITNNGLSRKNNEIIDLTKKNNELITQLNKLKSKWFVKVFD